MTIRKVETPSAPGAIGPYSQAVVTQGFVFVAGQIPLDPATGAVVEGGIAAQTERSLRNVQAILEAAGSSLRHVVKTTVLLRSMEDFAAMNEVYGRFFAEGIPPARAAFQVARLPKDVAVEIEAVAVVAG